MFNDGGIDIATRDVPMDNHCLGTTVEMLGTVYIISLY
jgi:hypothetical protein